MKKVIAVLAVVMLTIAVSAPAFAQQAQTPKGTEGPDVRKGENKTQPEGPDIRKSKNQPAASQKSKGTEGQDVRKDGNKTQPEGPDIRKSKKSPKASVKEKGTEGPDTRQKQEPKAAVDAGGRQSQEKKTQ